MIPNLGRLVKLSLREVWSSEAGDFTPWLAKHENLKLLGDSIGLALECDSQEKQVGPFRADILCKDSVTDSWVLIENQLERTDHSHLGQVLTYAAGLEAVTVVWVAERFTEEHRAALDWLNERTDEKINFFGLEVELWQIGNSAPAPKFNVVCKPNQWTRFVAETAKSVAIDELSDHRQSQYQYWTEFLNLLRKRQQVVEARTPRASHWMGFPIGRAGFRLWAELYHSDAIGTGLTFTRSADELQKLGPNLERELGFKLEWSIEPKRIQNYVGVYKDCDPYNRADWPAQHAWLAEKLERFQKTLGPYLKQLP